MDTEDIICYGALIISGFICLNQYIDFFIIFCIALIAAYWLGKDAKK